MVFHNILWKSSSKCFGQPNVSVFDVVQKLIHLQLFCSPMDFSPPASSVHEIFQARILEGVAFLSPGDLPYSGIEPGFPACQADSFSTEPHGKLHICMLVIVNWEIFNSPGNTWQWQYLKTFLEFTSDIQWIEGRDADKHLTRHRTDTHTKELYS